MGEILDSEHFPIAAPEIEERLTDSEIQRRKREAIDFADEVKDKSDMVGEMRDRDRTAKRTSFYFVIPWHNQ